MNALFECASVCLLVVRCSWGGTGTSTGTSSAGPRTAAAAETPPSWTNWLHGAALDGHAAKQSSEPGSDDTHEHNGWN